MRDFFRGWMRKAGCVTLVMACVLTSAWLRSFSGYEQLWSQKFVEGTSYSVWLWGDGINLNKYRVIDVSDILGLQREWSIGIPYWVAVPLTLLSAT